MKEFFRYICLFVILILVGVVSVHLYGIDANTSYFISEKELSKRKMEMLEKSQVTVVYKKENSEEITSEDVSNSDSVTNNKTEEIKSESIASNNDNVSVDEYTIEIKENYS